MATTRKAFLVLAALALAGLALADGAGAAPAADLAAMKRTAGPAVCRLSVENAWGVPAAVVSGFLLGDGRFIVSDLGAVAQPATTRVTVQFQDGQTAAATQFGMADPGLGLVALRVEADPSEEGKADAAATARKGLPLAPELPSLEGGVVVVAVGWRWGDQLTAVVGRLGKGPPIREVAARVRAELPAGVDSFVRMDGARLELASGSPMLDASGTVVAVTLDVMIRDTIASLAIPASSLRTTLLAAQPQLKPLSDLPKPIWPERVLRLPGAPPVATEVTRLAAENKKALRCPTCDGRGRVDWFSGFGMGRMSARSRDATVTCPTCHGERYTIQQTHLPGISDMVLAATRIAWAPTTDERTRASTRAAVLDSVKSLGGVGDYFVNRLAALTMDDLGRSALPRGVILPCQVRQHVEGPDGPYAILLPFGSETPVAVRVADLTALGAKGPLADHKDPADQAWIFLAGAVLSRFDSGNDKGFYILPVEWAPITAPKRVEEAPPVRRFVRPGN
jgi:hypothetical protein